MKFYTTKEVSKILNITHGTLTRWRRRGLGPKYHKIFGSIRYREKDINEWVESQEWKEKI